MLLANIKYTLFKITNFNLLRIYMKALFIILGFFLSTNLLSSDIKSHYIVRKGDSLWKIMKNLTKLPIEWQDLYSINPHIKNPNKIKENEMLFLEDKDGKSFLSRVNRPINEINSEQKSILPLIETQMCISSDNVRTNCILYIPIIGNHEKLILSNIIYRTDKTLDSELFISLGYRNIKKNYVYGIYSFFDYSKKGCRVSLGLEKISNNIEIRSNIYIPIKNTDKQNLSPSDNITYLIPSGIDIKAGFSVFRQNVKLSTRVYRFFSPNSSGIQNKLKYLINNNFDIAAEYNFDSNKGQTFLISFSMRFNIDKTKIRHISKLMSMPFERDLDFHEEKKYIINIKHSVQNPEVACPQEKTSKQSDETAENVHSSEGASENTKKAFIDLLLKLLPPGGNLDAEEITKYLNEKIQGDEGTNWSQHIFLARIRAYTPLDKARFSSEKNIAEYWAVKFNGPTPTLKKEGSNLRPATEESKKGKAPKTLAEQAAKWVEQRRSTGIDGIDIAIAVEEDMERQREEKREQQQKQKEEVTSKWVTRNNTAQSTSKNGLGVGGAFFTSKKQK